MEPNFEYDFTVCVAKLFYFLGAFITAVSIYITALSSGSGWFIALMVTAIVGLLPIAFVGMVTAIAGTAVAWLIRLCLWTSRYSPDKRTHADK